jgi:hypothetical protein
VLRNQMGPLPQLPAGPFSYPLPPGQRKVRGISTDRQIVAHLIGCVPFMHRFLCQFFLLFPLHNPIIAADPA